VGRTGTLPDDDMLDGVTTLNIPRMGLRQHRMDDLTELPFSIIPPTPESLFLSLAKESVGFVDKHH